jgi:hypothetical protein
MLEEKPVMSSYFNTEQGESIKIYQIENYFYYFNRGNLV